MKATSIVMAASLIALAGVAAVPTAAADGECRDINSNQSGWIEDCGEHPEKLALFLVHCFNTTPSVYVECYDSHTGLNQVP